MDTPLRDCLPLKVTGKIEIAIKDKDGVTIAKHLTKEDADYIVAVVNNAATLEALLKEAGEALELLKKAHSNWREVSPISWEGVDNVAQARAAEVLERIRALGGEA